MTVPSLVFNMSSYGTGLEGIVNYSNSLVNWWMVPVFIIAVIISISVTMSKREDRQYPMSAVLAYSFFVGFIAIIIFKLMTTVNEYFVFLIGIVLALAIAWGIWSNK